jgi:release factor glutamine methyltransferase
VPASTLPADVLAELVATLRRAGCVFAEDEAALLIDEATTSAQLDAMVSRRVAGEPLEQVLGWAQFCGLRILLEPGVFVPRRRTELMVSEAAELLREASHRTDSAVLLDLCCGSGAVGAAVLARSGVSPVEVHAADIHPASVRCARRNLAAIGNLAAFQTAGTTGTAAAVYQGDLFAPLPDDLRGRIDVLVANVPYVPTDAIDTLPPEARLHEPLAALDGGPDGLDVLRRVAAQALRWLAPGGALLVETSEHQAITASAILAKIGLLPRVASSEDLGATVLIGRRPTPEDQSRSIK